MKSIVLLIAVAMPALAQTTPQMKAPVQTRLEAQNRLITEQWEYTLRTSPEFASILGDKRYNDRLGDYTPEAQARDLAATKDFLARFSAIDSRGFGEQDRLNHDLMVRNLREQVEGAAFRDWEMPITQFDGLHINLPQLVTSLSFESVKDYEDYIARLRQVPRVMSEVTTNMRKGMADGLIPPKILLVQVASQSGSIAGQKAEDTPFAQPTTQFPATISAADKTRLTGLVMTAIRDSVLPAYVKFTAFVRDEYAPKGRTEIGTSALPDGKARYAFDVRRMTTTNMDFEAIHALGLKEVARIEAEQTIIAKQLGYANIKAFRDSIPKLAFLHPASRQAILDEYKTYIDQMTAKLPALFGRLPKAKLEILPIEPFREKEASTSYNQGAPDGSRPGHIFVNTYEFEKQLTINNESTAYHEGIPGHHMQISIAQELPSLPPFRQQAGYTAYVEGWALYSERLGKELGFYTDPYKNYGRLDDEMLRAIRLVVDTGIHGKHWTRDQVLDFFRAHSSINEAGIQAEADRYIALPGQALSYKVGQLSILRMRDAAKKKLGAKFDIRAFHDELLGAGALPIDVLEKRMSAWAALQAKQGA